MENYNQKEMLINELSGAINNSRQQNGLTIEEISQVVANNLGEDTPFLVKELEQRIMENHPLYKCQWCDKELEAEEFAEHMGICDKCIIKELEDKINTDFVEGIKPDDETDF